MDIEDMYWFVWSLAGVAALLGLVAGPLAHRRVSARAWYAHNLLVLVVWTLVTLALCGSIFGEVVPWWRIALACLADFAVPPLAASWAARAAVERWPAAGVWRLAAVGTIVMLATGALGIGIARALLPVIITAVA